MNIFQKLKIKLFGKERYRAITHKLGGDYYVYCLDVGDYSFEHGVLFKCYECEVMIRSKPFTIYRRIR